MNLYKKKNNPKNDRSHNIINGDDAEAYAKSKIVIALSGEINSSSRKMDNDKVDFQLNFQHPWGKEQLVLHFQVKSGNSYGAEILKERFKLEKFVIEKLHTDTKSVCLIWVNRDTSNMYWAFIHSKTIRETTEYGIHHQVTPATKYDLVRCFEQLNTKHFSAKGGKGIIIRRLKKTFPENREYAKIKYKTLKKSTIINPVLGKIECTRLAWRHITRKDRKNEFKTTSFDTTAYLFAILEKLPSSLALINCKYNNSQVNTTRVAEYILRYENVTLSFNNASGPSKIPVVVIVRLIETIIYPINWENEAQISQRVKRSVTLKSFYYKGK